jgi:hypothetical protein
MFGKSKPPSKEAVRDAVMTIIRDEIASNGPLIALLRREINEDDAAKEREEARKRRHFETGGTIDTDGNSYGRSYVYVSGSVSSGDASNDRIVIGVQHHAPKGGVWSPTSLRLEQVGDVIAALERARNHIVASREAEILRAPPPTMMPDA